jgi:hypothetical protein
VEGLSLPDGSITRLSQFIDDTNLMLKGTNLEKTMVVFKLYCKASGSKINWSKTKAIWVSEQQRSWNWDIDMELTWLQTRQSTRYLDFSVSYRLPLEEIDNQMI